MLAYIRFEVMRSVRDVTFVAFLVGLPVGLYLVYGREDAVLEGASFAAFFLVSMAAFAVMGSAMSATGPQLAAERMNGWTRQLRVTPLTNRAWLLSKVLHGLTLVAPGMVAVALTAVLYGGVSLALWQWVALAAVFVLGALPFVLIGLAIGLGLSVRAAQVMHTVVLFGMLFIGGVLVPWPQLPEPVQVVGATLPIHHLTDLGWDIVGADPVGWLHIVALAAWTAALAAGVLWLRRRELDLNA